MVLGIPITEIFEPLFFNTFAISAAPLNVPSPPTQKRIEMSDEVYFLSGLDPEKSRLKSDSYSNLILPEDREIFSNYLNKKSCV